MILRYFQYFLKVQASSSDIDVLHFFTDSHAFQCPSVACLQTFPDGTVAIASATYSYLDWKASPFFPIVMEVDKYPTYWKLILEGPICHFHDCGKKVIMFSGGSKIFSGIVTFYLPSSCWRVPREIATKMISGRPERKSMCLLPLLQSLIFWGTGIDFNKHLIGVDCEKWQTTYIIVFVLSRKGMYRTNAHNIFQHLLPVCVYLHVSHFMIYSDCNTPLNSSLFAGKIHHFYSQMLNVWNIFPTFTISLNHPCR